MVAQRRRTGDVQQWAGHWGHWRAVGTIALEADVIFRDALQRGDRLQSRASGLSRTAEEVCAQRCRLHLVVDDCEVIELDTVRGVFLEHRRADVRVLLAYAAAREIIQIIVLPWSWLVVSHIRFAAEIHQLARLGENRDGCVWPA